MKYQFIKNYTASYPDAKIAPRLFKIGEIIDGNPKLASVQCIKAPCPSGTALVGISTNDGLTIPMDAIKKLEEKSKEQTQKEEEQRDVLEGGLITILFPSGGGANYRLFIRFIFLVVIVYLVFKYAIPYIKNNFLNKGVK
jgi:hypothetical protein